MAAFSSAAAFPSFAAWPGGHDEALLLECRRWWWFRRAVKHAAALVVDVLVPAAAAWAHERLAARASDFENIAFPSLASVCGVRL